MTFGEGRELFLRYLNEATCGGEALLTSENADLRDRYNHLAGTAQRYIAAFCPLWAQQVYAESDAGEGVQAGTYTLTLPGDFLSAGELTGAFGPAPWRISAGKLVVGTGCGFPLSLAYIKLPASIAADAADDTSFELEERFQPLIPLYAAVEATAASDPEICASLRAIFQEKLANLSGAGARTAGVYGVFAI